MNNKVTSLNDLKEKYSLSNEVKANNKAFAKKVKITFFIINSLFLITYLIFN